MASEREFLQSQPEKAAVECALKGQRDHPYQRPSLFAPLFLVTKCHQMSMWHKPSNHFVSRAKWYILQRFPYHWTTHLPKRSPETHCRQVGKGSSQLEQQEQQKRL